MFVMSAEGTAETLRHGRRFGRRLGTVAARSHSVRVRTSSSAAFRALVELAFRWLDPQAALTI
jgi:hypothetical protein